MLAGAMLFYYDTADKFCLAVVAVYQVIAVIAAQEVHKGASVNRGWITMFKDNHGRG